MAATEVYDDNFSDDFPEDNYDIQDMFPWWDDADDNDDDDFDPLLPADSE